ncbi:hypothetical protein M2H12_14975 [Vibrio vulnificus]|nr:hypothetical protein [Vibrio vulnificus]MCU8167003.1 hypothetical protein [Vibrio vulnificus]MCU8171442.1 hypothetical protein [Vibrio vulnificus]MCU8266214.1 hypothetical protein [Vibrio vulnificus]
MAKEVGFMYCGGCDSRATVLENGGQKAGNYYTKCSCGTIQGGGNARQEAIKKGMVATVEEYDKNRLESVTDANQETVITVLENPEKTINNGSEPFLMGTPNKQTVIPMGGAGLLDDETVLETVLDDNEKPSKTVNKGFWAMCCGLATCAGLMIGYQVGVRRA